MSITNYTQNFITFLSNHSFTTEATKTIFDPISENKMGKCLRFTDDNEDITLINFDHNIRESKPEERVNNRKCLSDYIYKGKDLAKNYLIDNGFFVLNEDLYNDLKNQWAFFKNRLYNPVEYSNGNIGYDCKDYFHECLKNIEDSMPYNQQAKNACSAWRNKTRTIKNNNGGYTTYHETLSDISCFYYQQKYKERSFLFFIFMFIFLSVVYFISFIVVACLDIPVELGRKIVFFYLPLGLFAFYLFMYFSGKRHNTREDRKYQESVDKVKKFFKECDNKSQNSIKELEEAISKGMKDASESNMPLQIDTNNLSGNPIFDIDEFNCLFNLLMHCAYPYTFDNGEIYNPVYTVSYDSYIESIDKSFQMIDEYLDYCNEFVYPMIRAYGRKNNIDLRDLNTYIIEERRVDKRNQEICAKLERIYYGLQQLHKDNLRILDSLDSISSQLYSITNYQAITSAQLASIERKL